MLQKWLHLHAAILRSIVLAIMYLLQIRYVDAEKFMGYLTFRSFRVVFVPTCMSKVQFKHLLSEFLFAPPDRNAITG